MFEGFDYLWFAVIVLTVLPGALLAVYIYSREGDDDDKE